MWRTLPGAGTLVVREDAVLMVLHERSGRYRWELPSGLVDPGETFEQTAERETLEETGINVSVTSLFCTAVMDVVRAEYRGINAYFLAEPVSNNVPRLSPRKERISAVSFVDLDTLNSTEIHPVDRRILSGWRRKQNHFPFYVHIRL